MKVLNSVIPVSATVPQQRPYQNADTWVPILAHQLRTPMDGFIVRTSRLRVLALVKFTMDSVRPKNDNGTFLG